MTRQLHPRFGAVELSRLLGQAHPPTPEQVAVIEARAEPMLVVAGAGSGKTETMAARVVFLVANGLVRPDQVLGLTFTRKAAGQLAERIRLRLAALARAAAVDPAIRELLVSVEPEVSTYHAFGGRIISEYGPLVGMDAGARVLTPTAAWQTARQLVQRWDGDLDTDLTPDQVTERVLAVAASLGDHLRPVEDLAGVLQQLLARIQQAPPAARQKNALHSTLVTPTKRLADRQTILPLVQAYTRQKLADHTVDFADQMRLAAQLVGEHPQVGLALRDKYRVVLLDEYQDTGHAQRVILGQVFGAASGRSGHSVTAVGDPVQSIYTWRGASASNLPRFVTDFPRRDGSPARRLNLLTSFRNPVSVLRLANAVSDTVRRHPVPVAELSSRPGAPDGELIYGVFDTVLDEDAFVADRIRAAWEQAADRGERPPTTAVLLRRRADMGPLAEMLRARGLPVVVAGIGGLLEEPEIVDLVSVLRLLVDPGAGDAAIRVLTGARWQLGLADVAALLARAKELVPRSVTATAGPGLDEVRAALAEAGVAEDIEGVSLVDAIADPGTHQRYSETGFARIRRLAGELRHLRSRLDHPLPELVADLERSLGLDIEVLMPGGAGRAHLDAFADVVTDFAAARLGSAASGPAELLEYLRIAVEAEAGLAPGDVEVVDNAVQILTVHAAKGLEWELVAVPHLTDSVFPGGKGSVWLTDDTQLPPDIRGDSADIPQLTLAADADQKEISETITAHRAAWSAAELAEERRLLYVAVTRSEHSLIFTCHHFSATAKEARGPSPFYEELAEAAGAICPPAHQAPVPADGLTNPLVAEPRRAVWPVDPLGDRRSDMEAGALAVRRAQQMLALQQQQQEEAGSGRANSEPSADQGRFHDRRPVDSRTPDSYFEQLLEPDNLDEPEYLASDVDPPEELAPGIAAPEGLAPDFDELEDREPDFHEPENMERAWAVPAHLDQGSAERWFDNPVLEVDPELEVRVDPHDPGAEAGPGGEVGPEPEAVVDPHGWAADVQALLAERAAGSLREVVVDLPAALSVSALVSLAENPETLARQLRRPLPSAPAPHARRGTAFHAWLENFYTGDALVGFDDLPGADHRDSVADLGLEELQQRFRDSSWAHRVPAEIEVPFAMTVAGLPVRGRMDAVFAEPDGSWTVVDWKTGRPPGPEREAAVAVQLAAYRLAWARLQQIPVEQVRAVFHYVPANLTVAPVDLLDEVGLVALLENGIGARTPA